MIEGVLKLARPAVRELTPYSSARSLAVEGAIFLDANESPWGPFEEKEPSAVNRYPEPQPRELVRLLSSLYGVEASSIFVGRGTDDAIDALTRTFCEASRDAILICPPTYGVYEVAARIQGAHVKTVPTRKQNGFAIDPELVLKAWQPSCKLVYLCSPNNPTGNLVACETIEQLCRGLEGKSVVVLDEAYVEFASRPAFTARLSQFPNLVVLRTLSKAWALAGARCGVALAHPQIVDLLQKVRAPYPLSAPATKLVLKALSGEGIERGRKRVRRLVEARRALAEMLSRLAAVDVVYPSEANFLLVKVKSAVRCLEACRAKGIIIRDRSREPELADCIRISVGTDEENSRLLEVLSHV